MKVYNKTETVEKLKALHLEWDYKTNAIYKRFVFESFKNALDFINQVAEIVEDLNHHPKWTNLYNKVDVSLTTNDYKGVTEKDFELALKMEEVFSNSSDS